METLLKMAKTLKRRRTVGMQNCTKQMFLLQFTEAALTSKLFINCVSFLWIKYVQADDAVNIFVRHKVQT